MITAMRLLMTPPSPGQTSSSQTPPAASTLDVSVPTAYAAPVAAQADSRPWVMLCMVASIDGSTVVGGVSGGLSSETDSAVLQQLRRLTDVMLVGAGTVRAEGYGPPPIPGQRIGVVTRSGNIDADSELFTSGAGFVITTERSDADFGDLDVLRCGVDDVDLAQAIGRLGEVIPPVEGRNFIVQAEGGPALNAALFDADLIDEVDLTMSAQVSGGDSPRLTSGANDLSHRFVLEQLGVDDLSFLYTRWRRLR